MKVVYNGPSDTREVTSKHFKQLGVEDYDTRVFERGVPQEVNKAAFAGLQGLGHFVAFGDVEVEEETIPDQAAVNQAPTEEPKKGSGKKADS